MAFLDGEAGFLGDGDDAEAFVSAGVAANGGGQGAPRCIMAWRTCSSQPVGRGSA